MTTSIRSLTGLAGLLVAAIALSACGQSNQAQRYFDRGMALFESGDLVKAQLEFKNALQIDPKYAPAWFMVGRIAEANEDWRQAFSAYGRSVELAPENREARIEYGTLQLAAGNTEDALAQADAVLATDAADASALALRGEVKLSQEKVAEAAADARSALALEPDHREGLALLTRIQLLEGDLTAARQTLETALDAYPQDLQLQLAFAGVTERLGDAAGTVAVLRRIIEQEPLELAHRARLAQYLNARDAASAAEDVLREAIAAMPDSTDAKLLLVELLTVREGSEAGTRALSELIAAAPNDRGLRFALATRLSQAGAAEDAEAIYLDLIRGDPDGPDGQRARGQLAALRLAQGQTDAARQLVAEVLAKDAENSDGLLIRAALALQQDDADQAIADLRTILRNDPASAGALRLLATAHAARQELALAEDVLKKAIELAPDDPAAYLQLAALREQYGDLPGAGVALDDLLSRAPTNAAAQTALARIQQAQPDTGKMRETAELILRTRPEHPLGHYLLGLGAQRGGDLEASVTHFRTALEKEPRAAEPLVALTRSYLALQQYDQALHALQRALEQGADEIVAGNLLAEVYLAAGRLDDARAQYQRAIAQRPGAPLASERLARVQLADGQPAAAVDTLQAGIEASQGSPLLTQMLPLALEQAGRLDEAIAAYEALLAERPDADRIANNLAMLLANHRRDDPNAIARALSLAKRFEDSGEVAYLDTLGWVYFRSGDYQRAAEVLESVQAHGETTPEVQYHLGMAYLKLGRVDDARSLLTAALSAAQPFPGLEEARQALETL